MASSPRSRWPLRPGESGPVAMKRAYGLDVPETLAEALDPDRTALVVYDMQVGIMRQLQNGAEITAKVGQVLAAARDAGIRTYFLRHTSLPKNLMGVFQL